MIVGEPAASTSTDPAGASAQRGVRLGVSAAVAIVDAAGAKPIPNVTAPAVVARRLAATLSVPATDRITSSDLVTTVEPAGTSTAFDASETAAAVRAMVLVTGESDVAV